MNAEIIKKEFASYRVHFFDQADNEPSESNIYRLSDGPDFLIGAVFKPNLDFHPPEKAYYSCAISWDISKLFGQVHRYASVKDATYNFISMSERFLETRFEELYGGS
jgi:hypothetical protein